MNIDEVFNRYSNLCQFEEGSPEYLIDKEDFKAAIKEICIELLKLASEEVKINQTIYNPMSGNKTKEQVTYISGSYYGMNLSGEVDKESITNVINKIEGL